MADEGKISKAIRVGVRSDEGPSEITDEADLVVDGTAGVTELLAALAAD
jgi:trehalose 6-phosphate phosphatase